MIKEVKEYTKNPVSDIVLQVNEGNVTDIRADLHGPGIVSNASKLMRPPAMRNGRGFRRQNARRRLTTVACVCCGPVHSGDAV